MAKLRLQKIIAESGCCSRRKAEQLIAAGAVKVNGRPAALGDSADPQTDILTVYGEKISAAEPMRYIKLYKPRGYVTTMSDRHAGKPVADLLTGIKERVYPVGRLDKNSEGLLILTNDGRLANALTHPSHHVKKRYRVTVRGSVGEDRLLALASGVKTDSGVTAPCTVSVLTEEENRTVLEFILTEGKNRQIRKMCEAVNLEVARLKRVSTANVKLGMLRPGEWRDLTPKELKGLMAQLDLNPYGGKRQ